MVNGTRMTAPGFRWRPAYGAVRPLDVVLVTLTAPATGSECLDEDRPAAPRGWADDGTGMIR